MSRKRALTEELLNNIYKLKIEGYTNRQICKSQKIGESTFYGWLNPNCVDFRPEFQEKYDQAIKDGRQDIKDLAVNAIREALIGSTVEYKTYNKDGDLIRRVEVKKEPNAKLALELLQSLDRDNFPKEAEKALAPQLPPIEIATEELDAFDASFDKEF